MSKALRTVGMVVGAVALVAATAGLAAPAVAATATTAASAGGVLGVSAATLAAIGTYGSLAAGVLSMAAQATAPGFSAEGSATTFQTNPQSGLPYAMGRTRMSGLRVYARTYDGFKQQSKDDILAFVALLSIAGPIHSIEKFTADNELVTFAPNGDANGRFYRYMAQDVSLGNSPSTALALQFGGKPFPEWDANHKLSGIAHAQWALRFDTDGELYGAGAPEPAWTGKWVKVYDPRKDSTYPGGSGSHRALNEATYEWSDNPGLHALTWALGRWQNGKRVCGIGAPVANIRVAEFVECANVCDANDWKVGGVEWTTDSKWDTLKRILQAGGAIPTQTGAMIGCLVSTPRTAIATIESRHLHDGLSISATKSRRDRFNTVIPRYVDEDSDWAVISGTAVTEPVYVTADGGQRTKEIDFPLVQVFSGEEATQPGQLAAYAIVNSREAGPFTWTTGPEWIGLKTGDVVYLNVPEEGLVNQPVLITRRAPDPATGKVSFAGETETYSKHAYALGQTTAPPAPFSLTAPDLKPAAPLALNWNVSGATSGEGLPALLVTGASEMPSADAVVIDYRESGTEPWIGSAILSAVGPVSHTIAPLESEAAYDVRIGYRVGPTLGNFTIFGNVSTGAGKITELEEQLGEVAAALSITLTRPTATLWAYENGIVSDFSSANGLLKVTAGGSDVTASATLSSAATGCTGTINTAANTPVAGQPKGYYRVTAMPGDTAKLTLTAVYGGKTVAAEFQLTKIKAGYEIVASTLPTTNLFEGRLVYRESDGKLYRYKGGAWTAAISGADIDDASLTTAKFANGIEPVTLVTAVPTTKSTNAIFNSTDGKLYRWNGSAYVATVAGGDISNASLTTAKFASGIEPVTIVTGGSLPTAKSTNAIFYSGKLYRWNGTAYVATVQADDVTGKITSTQIDDNSIQTPHLAAGAVTASRMTIATANMCADPFFEDIAGYWNAYPGQHSLWNVQGPTGWASIAMAVPRTISLYGAQTERVHMVTGLIRCQNQGERMWLRGHVRNSTSVAAGSPLRIAVWLYDIDGVAISGQGSVDFDPATSNEGIIKSAQFTFPTNCAYYRIAVYNHAAYTSTGNISVSAIALLKAADAELIVDGAVLARHLSADSVIAGKVAAGAISTRELAAKAATIEKLAIGTASNMIPNSNFETLDGWTTYYAGATVEPYSGTEGAGLRIKKAAGTGEAGARMVGFAQGGANKAAYIPVSPGETYRVKCKVTRKAGTNAGNVGLYGDILRNDGSRAGTQIGGITSNTPIGVTQVVSGTYTIPADVCGMMFQIYYGSVAGSGNGDVVVTDMSVSRMAAGELIVDGEVRASHLAADSVIAGKVAAGAINSRELAAKSATIEKLAVVPESLIPDPYFADEGWWTAEGAGLGSFFFENRASGNGAEFLGLPKIIRALASGTFDGFTSAKLPYAGAGQVLRLRARCYNFTAQSGGVDLTFFNVAGGVVGSGVIFVPPGTGATDYSTQIVVPANAASMRLFVFVQGGTAGGYFGAGAIKLDVAASADLIVDGNVLARHVASDAIETNHLKAGAVTAAKMSVTNLAAISANLGNVAVSGNLLVDGTVNGVKIGNGAVDTGKIATEAVTKSYFASLAADIVGMTVNAQRTIISVALTGVTAGEVLRVTGILRLLCPDDMEGNVGISYSFNGGAMAMIGSWLEYKFDSDGGASTQMSIPLFGRLIAPSTGDYVVYLLFYNKKTGTDAGAGTSLDVMRQRR